MPRPIKDMIVEERCNELNFNRAYIDNIPKYHGSASTESTKVSLQNSEFGLGKLSVISSLRDKYKSIKTDVEECYVVFDKEYPVTSKQLRMLKALILEQVNRNEDYSIVISYVFSETLKVCISKGPYVLIEQNNSLSLMQIKVINEFQDYINDELYNGARPVSNKLELKESKK